MSQENVELSERAWDRFMAGDLPGVFALLDPDAELCEPPDLPGASVYHGHAGWRTQIDKFAEAFTNFAQVETWRAGKAVSIRYFTSRADALKAVGLEE